MSPAFENMNKPAKAPNHAVAPARRASSLNRPNVFLPPISSYFPNPTWRWAQGADTTPLEPLMEDESPIGSAQFDGAADECAAVQSLGAKHERLRQRMRNQSTRAGMFWELTPSFGQYMRSNWVDYLVLALMGGASLLIWLLESPTKRLFPITDRDGLVADPDIAWPRRKEFLTSWQDALIATFGPMLVFGLMQFRIRSFWDIHNAIFGLLYATGGGCLFQVILKWLIGGIRPNFLATCKPRLGHGANPGSGYGGLYHNTEVCTGNPTEIRDALQSFPSGHTVAGFAGFVFLSLYLNAKFKCMSNHRAPLWTLVILFAPLLLATLMAGALTVDKFHHWYDVVAGAIIGTVFALVSYRMVYASLFDYRFNHIPLIKDRVIYYHPSDPLVWGFRGVVFTREAGWGGQSAKPTWIYGSPAESTVPFKDEVTGSGALPPQESTADSSTRVGSSGQEGSSGQARPAAPHHSGTASTMSMRNGEETMA